MRASHFLVMAKPTQHTAPRRTYLLLLSLISLSLQLSFQNFPPGKNSSISRRPREDHRHSQCFILYTSFENLQQNHVFCEILNAPQDCPAGRPSPPHTTTEKKEKKRNPSVKRVHPVERMGGGQIRRDPLTSPPSMKVAPYFGRVLRAAVKVLTSAVRSSNWSKVKPNAVWRFVASRKR